MDAESFEVEDKVWVLVVWCRGVEGNVEVWIPESHSSRASVTENCEGGIIGVPDYQFEEADARRALKDLHSPRKSSWMLLLTHMSSHGGL